MTEWVCKSCGQPGQLEEFSSCSNCGVSRDVPEPLAADPHSTVKVYHDTELPGVIQSLRDSENPRSPQRRKAIPLRSRTASEELGSEKGYGGLRALAVLFQVLGWVSAIGLGLVVLWIVGLMSDARRDQQNTLAFYLGVTLAGGILEVAVFFALSKMIRLGLDVEENTRRIADRLASLESAK